MTPEERASDIVDVVTTNGESRLTNAAMFMHRDEAVAYVVDMLRAVAAEEREACALLAEIEAKEVREQYGDGHVSLAGNRIAAAIRAQP